MVREWPEPKSEEILMAKAPNYSVEQVQTLTDMYTPVQGESEAVRKAMVKTIAAKIGKKPGSVIAKLSNMDIYVKQVVVSSVTGDDPAKKSELAARLVSTVEANVDVFEGENAIPRLNPETMEKMNKTDLSGLIHAFNAVLQVAYPELFETVEDETEETEPSAEIVEDETANTTD
jgi:hypothetical protein